METLINVHKHSEACEQGKAIPVRNKKEKETVVLAVNPLHPAPQTGACRRPLPYVPLIPRLGFKLCFVTMETISAVKPEPASALSWKAYCFEPSLCL